jgi:hypothetical protein
LVEIKRNLKSGKDTIVTLKTIQECCRVCNKSYFFLCLNLRQYDIFVALAIAFNLGRNLAGTPGYRIGTESFFGLKGRPSVVRDVKIHNQPVLRMRRK